MSPRTHAPVFTDDSGARRVTVQWGGRLIALACVALWAALALTLGTQVSLPGLDRLPSLSDNVRRAIFPDTRLTAAPEVDRRQTELDRVSVVQPRSLPRSADDSSKARPAAKQRGSIKDTDRTEAAITGSATPGESARRPGQSKPETTPANPKSSKPAETSAPPTIRPNAHANPRAKAVVSKRVQPKTVGSKDVRSKPETRGQAQPDPKGKPPKTKAAEPAPRTSPSPEPGNDQPGQSPRGKPSAGQD